MSRRPRRVFGYARVSSEEQAKGTSLRDQQASITAFAKARKLTVTKFFVEAESAIQEKIELREQMRALLREVRSGDLIVCDKIDRWSRDPEFTYRTVREILGVGASFYAVAENLDPATPEGDTALGFRILFAREEHKRIRERMIGTRQRLRDQGYYVEGTPPYGYKRAHPPGHKGVEKNILVLDEEQAVLMRRAFIMCANGVSITKIAERLGQDRSRVGKGLHSRHYLGEIQRSDGTWVKGRHPPLIDAALFLRAQKALADRKKGGARAREASSQTDTWILRDVARCAACGAKMSAAYGPERTGAERGYYYRCFRKCHGLQRNRATNKSFIPVRVVEAEAVPLILARLGELRELLSVEPAERKQSPQKLDVEAKRARLEKKRDRYVEMYSDGEITKDDLRTKLERVDAELLRLSSTDQADPMADRATRRRMLRDVATLERAWHRATPARKRAIVNILVERALLKRDRPPKLEWRSTEALALDA